MLRNEGMTVTRGEASLFVAGVDDTWTKRADVERALADRKPGATTLRPCRTIRTCFPLAAKHGVESGFERTHPRRAGGDSRFWRGSSASRKLAHRFHLGLYRDGDSTLYVHPGLGTTGPPIRVGVAPEVAILTLRAAS